MTRRCEEDFENCGMVAHTAKWQLPEYMQTVDMGGVQSKLTASGHENNYR